MKKIALLIIAFVCVNIIAQDSINHWYGTYFYEKEGVEIPSLQFECVNQALLDKYIGKAISWGIPMSVEIPILEYSKLIKKDDISVYLLHLSAEKAFQIGFDLDINIPEGVIFYLMSENGEIIRQLTSADNITSKTILVNSSGRGINLSTSYNNCIIRVEIPKRKESKTKLIIKTLEFYTFPSGRNNESSINTKLALSPEETEDICAYVYQMPDYLNWTREWKSTFSIQTKIYISSLGSRYLYYASGFILNTSDNYDLDYNAFPMP